MSCKYCQGGRISVEPGSSLTYPCQDCSTRDEDAIHAFDKKWASAFRDCDDRDHIETEEEETKGTQ